MPRPSFLAWPQRGRGWRLALAAGLLLIAGCRAPATSTPPIAPPAAASPTVAPSVTAPAAISPTAPARQPGPAVITAPSFNRLPPPPDRDLVALARRLRGATAGTPSRPVPAPVLGEQHSFHVLNALTNQRFSVQATLRQLSPHAYFYVEEGASVTAASLEQAALEFEERIYPLVLGTFGGPGLARDGGPRLTVLHAHLSGASYFSSADEYPAWVNPYSNEREMLYLDIGSLQVGSPHYYATLAHELQHLVHWHLDSNEEAWVNEGLSELAADLAGYQASFVDPYLRRPDTQLTAWGEPSAGAPHYGASYLFFRYLIDHYGGPDALHSLVAEPAGGVEGVDAFLKAQGYSRDFDSVFLDWLLANLLREERGGYSYLKAHFGAPATTAVKAPAERTATVQQYGVHYLALEPPSSGYLDLRFSGSATARLLPTAAPSGSRFWWSNRGDSTDSTLTREFDLTSVTQASLSFKLWFDLEADYDFAYLESSADGGATWRPLPGRYTVTTDPVGLSYGPSYTGCSGGGPTARWLDEQVDLSPFVGGRVLLRFEVVTDEAYNRPGLALDDLALQAVGFLDDAESDQGWRAAGFLRTDNLVPQRYSVRLVVPGDQPQIIELSLDAANQGSWRVALYRTSTLVISALAPVTTEPASYSININPALSSK